MTVRTAVEASVGDAGVWLIRDSGYGTLTERQYRRPLLGNGGLPVPFEARHENAILRVAADGLLKYAIPTTIRRLALWPNPQDAVRALADSVRLRSGGLQGDIGVAPCRPATGAPPG
ncbi:MAG TPA: hypothetical protein PKY77_17595 [Phycisphaerae bacterium]|nr:hypothetical protein [Phycisphaerae bacterium]HRY69401.1 hypothetical protein [Phycisphaerae bacterium]HSA26268.1 hypothetical protein [Phycisphaerae bacterium]